MQKQVSLGAVEFENEKTENYFIDFFALHKVLRRKINRIKKDKYLQELMKKYEDNFLILSTARPGSREYRAAARIENYISSKAQMYRRTKGLGLGDPEPDSQRKLRPQASQSLP